jgi:uncharacterized tellurite resistance protein B-like protein
MSAKTKAILKKVLWIVLAAVGLALLLVLVIPLLVRNKKSGQSPVREIIEKTKLEVDKAEIEAQIEIAKAQGKEEAVIKELESIKKETDRRKRLERLSALLD